MKDPKPRVKNHSHNIFGGLVEISTFTSFDKNTIQYTTSGEKALSQVTTVSSCVVQFLSYCLFSLVIPQSHVNAELRNPTKQILDVIPLPVSYFLFNEIKYQRFQIYVITFTLLIALV